MPRAVAENTEIALAQIGDGRIIGILRRRRDLDDAGFGLKNGILSDGEFLSSIGG